MNNKEEQYLQNKIDLIRAVVSGTLMGAYMFGVNDETKSMGDKVQYQVDMAMKQIERDVRNIYKHAKRTK